MASMLRDCRPVVCSWSLTVTVVFSKSPRWLLLNRTFQSRCETDDKFSRESRATNIRVIRALYPSPSFSNGIRFPGIETDMGTEYSPLGARSRLACTSGVDDDLSDPFRKPAIT